MVEDFDHKKICEKWRKIWLDRGVFNAVDDRTMRKFYVLIEFPYPSGDGLHVGHPRSYAALDVIARKRRMEGYNVLYPIGFDAFGLPTENYALKTGEHPRLVTERNVDRYRRQLQSLGFSFDWSREVNTTDPAYYKWTQWIFLKLF
ncbi:MAG: class I tRNA ligase family protein, partial [Planctomycetota bacterium]